MLPGGSAGRAVHAGSRSGAVRRGSILGNAATDLLWGGPSGFYQVWPDSPDNAEYRTVRPSDVAVDASQFGPRAVDFEPAPLTMSAIGRILLGVATGGALLAVLLLVAMARHARRRGGFRRRTGAWLRVLTPVPLGLGGWLLAVLLVRTIPYGGGPGRRDNGGTGRLPVKTDGPAVPDLLARWREVDSCPAPTESTAGSVTTSTAQCPDGRAVEVVTVAGAGHQWPARGRSPPGCSTSTRPRPP